MNKYRVVCTLWQLPKHQRRKLLGKNTVKKVLNHNIRKEKSFFLAPDEVNMEWDNLAMLSRRGEIEVRNPDGTILRFNEKKEPAPPPEVVEQVPAAGSAVTLSTVDVEDIEDIVPLETSDTVEEIRKQKRKRKGRKKKKSKSD